MPRLIDAYKVRIDRDDFDTYSDYITALDAVTEAPTVDADPKWIPCSERLPDESDAYLVTNCNYVCPVELAVFKADGAYWTDAYIGKRYKDSYIIAWMPLPEKYKPYEVE